MGPVTNELVSRLGLDAKCRLLGGKDMWSLYAFPEIGLRSLVMSDGPIGVRGVHSDASDHSVALPSPTALAATWSPSLARRAGRLLAKEARRKGVDLLLAPTINLHRSPRGGRHFECYSEDAWLTAVIGAGYVEGVQSGGVGATVKHFVANDAETDRFTVNNIVGERALRELYLAPFEHIVKTARPWAIMNAYNSVNGPTMTEHDRLNNGVLRGEWGFDGCLVSDWTAARDTVGCIKGGLDMAMPGPDTVYGEKLAAAVRAGEVDEAVVDAAVANVLRLAERVGAFGTPPAPPEENGRDVAREVAVRSFVLLKNDGVLPLAQGASIALIGKAAEEARALGGGSAQVSPQHVVSPLEGLSAVLGELTYTPGPDPNEAMPIAGKGFQLHVRAFDDHGELLGEKAMADGNLQWFPGDVPGGARPEDVRRIEMTGTFSPALSGAHKFGSKGVGRFEFSIGGKELFNVEYPPVPGDEFAGFFGPPRPEAEIELVQGETVELLLNYIAPIDGIPISGVGFGLGHQDPRRPVEELIEDAVGAASVADIAVVVVATTETVESEGFDRPNLHLPGAQDELVERVAAVNPRTVVVVNAGSPVEMPWRDKVAAVLLTWFPGQEGGGALADVLTGAREPGGRLPTTWPARLEDAPVTEVTPQDGKLVYEEGVFIGYRAWDRSGRQPGFSFGHGLGYTSWAYSSVEASAQRATVRVQNTGSRPGREVVQGTVPVGGSPASPTSSWSPAKVPTWSWRSPSGPSKYGRTASGRGSAGATPCTQGTASPTCA
jgi:beta-glucosidase